MSRTAVRVLAVLELLQAHDRITGAEIADQLQVDARSVRRYVKQLQEMGIPVQSEQGRYGAYRLEKGYRLPPLMFREEEVIALIVGLLVIRAQQFPLDPASIAGALAKIQRTVPKQFFDQVDAIQDTMHFQPVLPKAGLTHSIVDTVARGAWKNRSVKITYQSRAGEDSERLIDPYGVVVHEGDWYTVGYCHLRKDLRVFRLDRIVEVQPSDNAFTPWSDFDPLDYVVRSLEKADGFKLVEVVFHTTLEVAQSAMPPGLGEFEVVENKVIFRCRALRLDWIAALMLSLDFPIRILQPEALKEELSTLAQKALKISKA